MSEVNYDECCSVNFVFSKKATKIEEIFTIDLTLTTLESGIDVGHGINIGPGKFVKKNKCRALNKRRA